jgi:hypothetical protein
MPEIKNIHPIKIATARLASGGTTIAASPRTTSRMPSNKNATQCSRKVPLISDCNRVKSSGVLMHCSCITAKRGEESPHSDEYNSSLVALDVPVAGVNSCRTKG